MLACGDSSGSLFLYDIQQHNQVQLPLEFSGHAAELTCVSWSAFNQDTLATCSDDLSMRVWQLNRDPVSWQHTKDANPGIGSICPESISLQIPLLTNPFIPPLFLPSDMSTTIANLSSDASSSRSVDENEPPAHIEPEEQVQIQVAEQSCAQEQPVSKRQRKSGSITDFFRRI